METLEYSRAIYELYQGAIYLHQGRKYLILEFNVPTLTAHCELVHVAYHTSPKHLVKISILRQIHSTKLLSYSLIRFHSEITGFVKIWANKSQQQRGKSYIEWGGECHLPSVEYPTCGLIVNIPNSLQVILFFILPSHQLSNQQTLLTNTWRRSLCGSIHIANHAILIAAQLFLNRDMSSDLETEHRMNERQYRSPTPSPTRLTSFFHF